MRYFTLILLLFFLSQTLHSQTLTVIDAETHLPMELVTLMSEKPIASTVTNAKGQADISDFKHAKEIQIRSLGYKTLYKSYKELLDENLELTLYPGSINISEVVISASKWRQSTDDIPSKVLSISTREIDLQNPQTAADMLGVSGRVFIQKSQQGGGSPMIRGFATNRLLYSIDGVRMNTAIFRGGNIQNVINIDPFAVQNTEVFFGPGSVIYGSDAIGGVMSFQTLHPNFSLSDKTLISGKGVTRFASANHEKTAHFDVNVGWKKWAFTTSISHWDYDHLRQGSHGPDDYIKNYYVQRQGDKDIVVFQDNALLQIPTAYSQFNFMQKLRYKVSENWELDYGFHYSKTSTYGRYDRHNRMKDGLPRYAEWNYGPQLWSMHQFKLSHDIRKAAYDQMNFRLSYQQFKESRINRLLNELDRNIQEEQVDAYSFNLDFTKKTHTKNALFYGAEYIINDVNSQGKVMDIVSGMSEIGASRYPTAQWQSFGVYLNDDYKLSNKVTLQAGLRYNLFQLDADFSNNLDFFPLPFSEAKLKDASITGSLGAVFKPIKSFVINANLGTAFRAPNVDDIGKIFDSEPGAVTIPNPDLKAEYAYNLDLGVAKTFKDFLKVDLTGFYTILDDALVRRDFTLNGESMIMYDGELSQVQAIQNAAEANVYGLQMGVDLKLPYGFSIVSDINVQNGEEELDDGSKSPSRHAAPLFGTSRISFKKEQLSIEYYMEYQGEKAFKDMPESEKSKTEIYALDANGNPYAPAWTTMNLKALYRFNDQISMSSGIENIGDIRYRPYSSGLSGAGRNFIFSLKYAF